MYESETLKVDLDGGQYAVFFKELRHGTQKEVNRLTRPFLKADGKTPVLTLRDEKASIEGSEKVEVEMTKVNWDEINDAIIIGQIKEWSFGRVDMEVLDNLPDAIQRKLKAECDRLYGEASPLPSGGGGN